MSNELQVFLDTETTGKESEAGHRVIEIGATVVNNGMHTGEEFHELLNPEREIDEAATQVHGFTWDDLIDKPHFEDIVERFLQFVQGKRVFMHNAAFDVQFLDSELELLNRPERMSAICSVVDTMELAKQVNKTGQVNLDVLCTRYGVDRTDRDKHGALLDAQLLSEVYLRMIESRNTLLQDVEDVNSEQFEPVLLSRPNRKLNVVYATEHELKAHEEYLLKLATQRQSG